MAVPAVATQSKPFSLAPRYFPHWPSLWVRSSGSLPWGSHLPSTPTSWPLPLVRCSLSIHELIPMAQRYRRVGLFILGMIFSVLVYGCLARITIGQRIDEGRIGGRVVGGGKVTNRRGPSAPRGAQCERGELLAAHRSPRGTRAYPFRSYRLGVNTLFLCFGLSARGASPVFKFIEGSEMRSAKARRISIQAAVSHKLCVVPTQNCIVVQTY
jgi:hypothetical protein